MNFHAEAHLDIACAPDLLFDFAVTRFFDTWRSWNPDSIELRALDPGPLRIGLRGVEARRAKRGRAPPRTLGRTIEVTELVPGSRVTFAGIEDHPGREAYTSTFAFAPTPRGTLVMWTFTQEIVNPLLAGLGGIVRLKWRWTMRSRLKLLKKLLEAT